MNIVVLCGGTSSEREVSIVSGTNVAKALISKGHNARLLDVFFGTYKTNKTAHPQRHYRAATQRCLPSHHHPSRQLL